MKLLCFKNTDFDSQTVSIGVFDGVHKGHLQILSQLIQNPNPAVITFYPHPRKHVKLIAKFSERLKMFKKLGIQRVYIISPSSDNVLAWSAKTFIEKFILTAKIKKIIVGYDFKLGHNRDTDVYQFQKLCKQYNVDVEIVNTINDQDGHKLSSTDIRTAISNSDLEHVKNLLGNNFFVTGVVSKGSGIAKDLGFKTMNITASSSQLIPSNGVYKTKVVFLNLQKNSQKDINIYDAISYIGNSPTLKKTEAVTIETHIPNFDKNVYGQKIKVFFKQKIRDEYKFSSKQELLEAINKDVNKVSF